MNSVLHPDRIYVKRYTNLNQSNKGYNVVKEYYN